MDVSNHAEDRLHERMNLSRESYKRMSDRIRANGLRREDTSGPLRRYMDKKYSNDGCELIVYGEFLYVLGREECLVTVWQIPAKLRKIALKLWIRRRKTNEQD